MTTPNSQQPHWQVQQSATPPAITSPILTRVVNIGRGFMGLAGAITLSTMVAEATLPAEYRPSTWIGRFHGRVEGADATAKVDPVTNLTRRNAEAASEPPAFAAMETEAFRQQQQMILDSMQGTNTTVNTLDMACNVGKMIPRDSRDWGWLSPFLSQACGVGDEMRQEMLRTLRRAGQNNSVLIQRPRAGGSGSR